MDDWEKFNETSLTEKEDFYSHLNMEHITAENYAHADRVCKDFETKKLGECHGLYVQTIHYCKLMYSRTLGKCVLKYMSLILQNVFQLRD